MTSQDDFYRDRESEEWFQRNLADFRPDLQMSASGLRANKLEIYSFLNQNLEINGLKVLEIGCAVGDLLYVLQSEHGCEVRGVEPSPSACNVATNYFGLNVELSTFFQSSFFSLQASDARSYDLVLLDDVVGWFAPETLLSSVAAVDAMLATGGHLFVRELWSPGGLKVRNHHHPESDIYNYRYPGGFDQFFLNSGMFEVISSTTRADFSLQKVSSSSSMSTWKDSLLRKKSTSWFPEKSLDS